jgi:hypothetical protein
LSQLLLLEFATTTLAVASFAVSLYTLWSNQLNRGRVRMTRPSLIFFGRDRGDGRIKIWVRALLYCTANRGRVVESLYVRLTDQVGTWVFDRWIYGDHEQLSAGSGLFVSREGVAHNHHFLLRRESSDEFAFWGGAYRVEMFAKSVGAARHDRILDLNVVLPGDQGAILTQIVDAGAFLEWDSEKSEYISRIERYSVRESRP